MDNFYLMEKKNIKFTLIVDFIIYIRKIFLKTLLMNKIILLAVLALGGYANAQQQKNQQLKKKLEQQTAQKRLELEFYKQNQGLSTLSKDGDSTQNPLSQLKTILYRQSVQYRIFLQFWH